MNVRATYIPGQFSGYVRQLCTAEECNMVARAIGHKVKPVIRQSNEIETTTAGARY